MKGEASAVRKQGEGGDVVDDTVGEVGGGADEQDCVAIDEAGDGWDVYCVRGGRTSDEVDFDGEV